MELQNKLMPNAIELEEAVIGAMMIDSAGRDDVFSVINDADVFYKKEHKVIFSAMKTLYDTGKEIDLLTVVEQCKTLGTIADAGGEYFLIQLTQKISSSAHSEYHARLILQKFVKRKVIFFCAEVTAMAYDDTVDVFDLLDRFQLLTDKMNDYSSNGRLSTTFAAGLEKLKKQIEFLSSNTNEIKMVGIDTGFQRINKKTGGYRNQDLLILAARPGQGKTAKAIKTVVENVKKGIPTGFISGEMSADQLIARAVAVDTNFHLNQLMNIGFVKPEYFATLQYHIDRMKNYPFIIDDSGRMDINDVVVLVKQWKRKFDIKFLVIDYIQLMTDRNHKGSNRTDELAKVSRRLKLLAKELNIPIQVLAQVNRDCEKRSNTNKRPIVSDIKDCGAIEQDADIIEFIYRPEVYGLDLDPEDYPGVVSDLIPKGANAEVIFAKYRGGATGATLLKWVGDKTKFVDVEDKTDNVDYIDEVSIDLLKITPADAFGNNETNLDDIPF